MKIFKAIKKGFTLVELVIVIAVIAVLSAVLIPVFGNVVKDSRVSATKASLKTCTSNLIMYSLYNQVDYYTPSVIRDFLKSEGIKGLTSEDSKFCEDGYSVWYNQENYNFYLIKNSELAEFVNSSASVNNKENATAFTANDSGTEAGASEQLKRVPRRPEAITPDENLLLIATDKANKHILSGIEKLYVGADTDKGVSSAQEVINVVENAMDNGSCTLFDSFNGTWKIQDYTAKFNPATTAWLNNVGNFVTDAVFKTEGNTKTATIENVIVSPYLGFFAEEGSANNNEITGNIRQFGQSEDQADAVLKVVCVIEITSANNIELGELFYGKFANEGVSIITSGNVSVQQGVPNAFVSGTTTVSTVTGGGSNISSVVNAGGGSAVVGGGNKVVSSTISASEFLSWATGNGSNGKPIINCSNATVDSQNQNKKLVSVKLPNGTVQTQSVDNSFFENNLVGSEAVQYKYNVSSFAINVSEFLHKVGITSDDQVRSIKIKSNAYNNVYSTSVYLEYEIDNVIYGKAFNFGVGHITSFDHYYRFSNGGYVLGENDYSVIDKTSADAGSVLVKLPEGALSLQSYKSGYTVEVVYDEVTRFFKTETSEFGREFQQFQYDVVGSEKTKSFNFNANDVKDECVISFGSFNRGEKKENTDVSTFINMVKIKRVLIKDLDGNILIAKYPQAENVQYVQ